MIFLQILQMIIQLILMGVFLYWIFAMIHESTEKDRRIDSLMLELHDIKYRTLQENLVRRETMEKLLAIMSSFTQKFAPMLRMDDTKTTEPTYERTNE